MQKICIGCGVTKKLDDFYAKKSCIDGRENRCKDCRRKRFQQRANENKSKVIIPPENKYCPKCKVIKPSKEFPISRRRSDGIGYSCKNCHKKYGKSYRKDFSVNGGGVKNRYRALKANSQKAGLECLPVDDFIEWWHSVSDNCFYCESDIEKFFFYRKQIMMFQFRKYKQVFYCPSGQKIKTMTVDRKNPDIGYLTHNMVKSCWICNYIKAGIMTDHEYLLIVKSIFADLDAKIACHVF